MPPEHVADPVTARGLAPAPDVWEWAEATFVRPGGALHNRDHAHLIGATIGVLWMGDSDARKMRTILADARLGEPTGSAEWQRAEARHMRRVWFGTEQPDFIVRLYAPFWAECSDADACALIEHELYHCAQALDAFGSPRYRRDGSPIWAMRGHDVEEFVGVVARYGADSIDGSVRRLIEADAAGPRVASANIAAGCGTCHAR